MLIACFGGIRRSPRRRTLLLASLLLAHVVPALGQQQPLADDEIEPRPPAGLLARFEAAEDVVVRIDDEPAVFLSADQSPDPRLPAGQWTVRWTGQIESIADGQYHFAAEVQGRLGLWIDGREVLAADSASPTAVAPAALELAFGWHEIQIDYAPAGAGARLRLFWQSDLFAREPIPPGAWARSAAHPELFDAASGLDRFVAGRLLVEEHSCVACHQQAPADAPLTRRPGPRLVRRSDRLNAAWVDAWLADPHRVRAGAVMPGLFSNDPVGELQRRAVAELLAGAPAAPTADPTPPDPAAEQLYYQIGCAACHEAHGNQPARTPLPRLSEKYGREHLAAFLRDPLKFNPAGRMPSLNLSADEASRLATWLLARDDPPRPTPAAPERDRTAVAGAFAALHPDAATQARFAALADAARFEELGKAAIAARRCQACHELAPDLVLPNAPATAPLPNLAAIREQIQGNARRGCLAATESARAQAPAFGPSLDRPLAEEFLLAAARAWAAAPAHDAQLALARFNCLACHDRNGRGGLAPELRRRLEGQQTEQNAELITPPSLTGIAHKLRPAALAAVLTEGARARPWMALRMPTFPPAALAPLPGQLAADEARVPAEETAPPPADPALAEAGRTLVGSSGFGCTKCHDMLGHKSAGTRGPDLAGVADRIDRTWYERWMTDPQRIAPGTRMPTVFFQGQSPYKHILDGDPARQREAMWQFLLACRSLPLPEGTLPAPEPIADALPALLRTFLPDVSPRSIALRGAHGVHVAFDAQSCRLAYAWHGDFLDPDPAWGGRGGRPANLLGEVVWRAPEGFPWALTGAADPVPDFAARAAEPALGATPPEDFQVYPRRVHFRGYRRSGDAYRWRFDLEDPAGLARFEERVTDWRDQHLADARFLGIARHVRVEGPPQAIAWLRVATADSAPQAVAAGEATYRVGDGHSAVWYRAQLPPGAQWHAHPTVDNRHDLVISLPLENGAAQVTLWVAVPVKSVRTDDRVACAILDTLSRAPAPGGSSP